MHPLCTKKVPLPFKISFILIQLQKCRFFHEKPSNFRYLLEFIFYSKHENIHLHINRLIGQRVTKKAPPSSRSTTTRVDQEGGGAQIFIKAKNGRGQTQFWANLV